MKVLILSQKLRELQKSRLMLPLKELVVVIVVIVVVDDVDVDDVA